MGRARYICLEGTEGVGKTTQTDNLVNYLKSKGYKVIQTKEPGTPLSPVTMELRNLMLNNKYDKDVTGVAREYISQAIRAVHLNSVVKPNLNEVDFIVQDRGILSGLAYGTACGNDFDFLESLAEHVTFESFPDLLQNEQGIYALYNDVLYLKGNVSDGLDKALNAKQEFEDGDAIESRGVSFLEKVSSNMDEMSVYFNAKTVDVTGKGIEEVFADICNALKV